MSQAFDAVAQQQLLERRVSEALELARSLGADACEVGASVDQGVSISVRDGEVETVELSRDQGIGVTVYLGNRKGSATSSDAGSDSIPCRGRESGLHRSLHRRGQLCRIGAGRTDGHRFPGPSGASPLGDQRR